jgi:hypothetical protein
LKSIVALRVYGRASQVEEGTRRRLSRDLDALEIRLRAPRCGESFDQAGRKLAGNSATIIVMPIAGLVSAGIIC